MKKKSVLFAVSILLLLAVFLSGCSLFGSSGALSSLGGSTNDKISEYQKIVEKLLERNTALEEDVREALAASNQNIGAYAGIYVDSLVNITCVESTYNIGCQGTGFIVSEDGYVITNNHVISYEETVTDYDKIIRDWFGSHYGTKVISGEYSTIYATFDEASVYYSDGKTYTLQFVYRDPDLDLALLKLVEMPTVGTWKAIPFYEGTVSRGDQILVLGNAQGFGLSATSGLVSATGKKFSDSPKLTFIQTDAAINSGNSGGPAINIYGGLIGVVNSKFNSSSIENMGFAIELSKVKTFIADAQTAKGITVSYKTVTSGDGV